MRSYALAILVVHGLSGFSLAAQVHARWFMGTRWSFPVVYAAVLGLVVAWGVATVGTAPFAVASWQLVAASLLAGVPAGLAARLCEERVLAAARRRGIRPRVTRLFRPLALTSGKRRRRGGFRQVQDRRRQAVEAWRWTFPTVAVVAVLEEAIHRGLLLEAARGLPGPYAFAAACAGLTAMFALSHLIFGWTQVLAKLPLGLIALGLALGYGTVLPAMVAHLMFNVTTLRQARRTAPQVRGRHTSGGTARRRAGRVVGT